ncbi:hypothetical protein KPL71_017399 [Citrus sinensis]|uniref:Uncharacterized protein n=1 Tax=Citrus sinensis TaxID=2711 RepID=A0ACB8JQN6_CITSI|nr:hypothetical protein KPL71_017399 [Citrus sinensis]
MATNKERIERVEAELGDMQDSMKLMELGINDKLHHLEETLSKLAELISASKGTPSHNNHENAGEANQWWQWLHKAYKEEGCTVTWEIFVEELWARFGPTECEDFDEALSLLKQTGSLRDYQKEFERLGNRVHGWSQKALKKLLRPSLNNHIPPAQPIINRVAPTVPFKRLSWEEMQRCRAQEESLSTAPPDMQDLLKGYMDLFQELTQLPPTCEIDHRITLKEGIEPVNVRPYHYAYFQEAEIEKQLHRQSTVFKCAHQKLASEFFGPYQILHKVGNVAYKLQLPAGSRIHPVFRVSLLKKVIGNLPQSTSDLPSIDDEGVLILKPDYIVDARWLKRGSKFVEQSLVRWKRLPREEATWEDTDVIKQRFPHMTLVLKGPLYGGGINKEPRKSKRTPKPNNTY